MICLADTDVTLKLAACDLLPKTLAVLGVSGQDVYIYKEEALRVYRFDPDVKEDYSEEVRMRAIKFVNDSRAIYNEIDPEEQEYMLAAGIDTGEQAIFGATRESAEFIVLMADRNALRKISAAPMCGEICARMNGRIWSLDQIVLMLIQQYGHADLMGQIQPHLARDIAFQVAFTLGVESVEAQSRLKRRILDLRAETYGLLALPR